MTYVRASDAEREATIARLRDAAAEGRLTFEELADRIETASAAVMRSQPRALTHDLPASVEQDQPSQQKKSEAALLPAVWFEDACCSYACGASTLQRT